jgi:hypothetical protein
MNVGAKVDCSAFGIFLALRMPVANPFVKAIVGPVMSVVRHSNDSRGAAGTNCRCGLRPAITSRNHFAVDNDGTSV